MYFFFFFLINRINRSFKEDDRKNYVLIIQISFMIVLILISIIGTNDFFVQISEFNIYIFI